MDDTRPPMMAYESRPPPPDRTPRPPDWAWCLTAFTCLSTLIGSWGLTAHQRNSEVTGALLIGLLASAIALAGAVAGAVWALATLESPRAWVRLACNLILIALVLATFQYARTHPRRWSPPPPSPGRGGEPQYELSESAIVRAKTSRIVAPDTATPAIAPHHAEAGTGPRPCCTSRREFGGERLLARYPHVARNHRRQQLPTPSQNRPSVSGASPHASCVSTAIGAAWDTTTSFRPR